MPINQEDESEMILDINGKHVRVVDVDYAKVEWVEELPPLRDKHRVDDVTCKADATSTAASTAASDGESAQDSDSSRTSTCFSPGDCVMIHGLRGALELNGRSAKIIRYVPKALRYEVALSDTAGTKAVKPANLRLL